MNRILNNTISFRSFSYVLRLRLALFGALILVTMGSPSQLLALTWGQPETIGDPSYPQVGSISAIVLDTGPAVVFPQQSLTDSVPSVGFIERAGNSWSTSTIVSGTFAEFPLYVAAAVHEGVPYVGAGLRDDGVVRIFSRPSNSWQQEYVDPQVDGLFNQQQYMGMTVADSRVFAAYADHGLRREIMIVEQTHSGWTAINPGVNLNLGIDNISAATINGEPMFLLSEGGSGATYLGRRDQVQQWQFEFATSRRFAKLADWQGLPAMASPTDEELFFDYLNTSGVWQSETIVSNTGGHRATDLAVISGTPMVAYFDVDGADAGLHVAVRQSTGTWDNQLIALGTNNAGYGIDIFEQQGLPGIAYFDRSTFTLNIIQVIPEPSSAVLMLTAACTLVYWNTKRVVEGFGTRNGGRSEWH